MDELKICRKCGIEKLLIKFHFRKDSRKCRNRCKQSVIDKRRERRSDKYEKTKFFTRKYFQQNEKEIIGKRKMRRHTNTYCRIFHNIQSRIKRAVKGNVKTSSTKNYLELILISVHGGTIIR